MELQCSLSASKWHASHGHHIYDFWDWRFEDSGGQQESDDTAPCKQSQDSASLRTMSSTESMSSAPSV